MFVFKRRRYIPSSQNVILNELIKRKFLPKMSKNRESIGKVLVGLAPFFKSYEAYCTGFDRANEMLNEIDKSDHSKLNSKFLSKSSTKRFLHFLKMAKSHPQHTQLNLQSYLILPIQRLPRYKLLLNELLNESSEDNEDFSSLSKAKQYIEEQIMQLNEKKRLQQDAEDIQGALTKITIHSGCLKEATRKITTNAGKFIHKGALNALCLIERTSPHFYPLLDIARASDRDRYTQQSFLGVLESVFGVPSTKNISEEYLSAGKSFYFFKFKNLLIWCRLRPDSNGRNEYLAAMAIEDEEIIEFSNESSLLRIKGDGCVLYLEASISELKKWRHWR